MGLYFHIIFNFMLGKEIGIGPYFLEIKAHFLSTLVNGPAFEKPKSSCYRNPHTC
jgi:hypothetical protein